MIKCFSLNPILNLLHLSPTFKGDVMPVYVAVIVFPPIVIPMIYHSRLLLLQQFM